MEMISNLPGILVGNVVPALIVLTVVVFVHEMGHFLVARWCGIQVAAFSIGFGPELAGFTDRHGTRWKLSAVPLGGYVRFKGDENAASIPDPEAMAATPLSERQGLFHFAPLWKRVAVVAAGPVANFVLAIVVFAAVFVIVGRPHVEPIVGTIDAGSPAESAGLQKGDRIVGVNTRAIEDFGELDYAVATSGDERLAITVERRGDRLTLVATPQLKDLSDITGRSHQVPSLGAHPQIPAVVGSVEEGSAAEAAGFRPGDRVLSVDGGEISSFTDLQEVVANSAGHTLAIVVDRGDTRRTLSVTPTFKEVPDATGHLRVGPVLGIKSGPGEFRRDDPITALSKASGQTLEIVERTLGYLGQLVIGHESPKQLSGVIGISQVSGAVAENSGIAGLIYLIAVLSVSIGLFNLFPVPILDGGHLLFYAIEAVRGRPLSPRLQDIGFRIGFALVIMLFIFVTFNDIANISGIFVKS